MPPDQEADQRDGHAAHGDEPVAEDVAAAERRDHLADDAHGRQDHDVHGRMGVEPEEVLEEDRVAADSTDRRMPKLNSRSRISSSSVMPSTGVARIWMIAVAYSAQRNSGMRNQVMPGGRSLWIVTMKLIPVKMELKPRMKRPEHQRNHRAVGLGAVGRVERPAGVDRADQDRRQCEHGADHVEVVAPQVEPRKGHVLGAQHERQHEIAEGAGNAGDEHQEDHHRPVEGEQLVVGLVDRSGRCRGTAVPSGLQQLRADQHGEHAAQQERRQARKRGTSRRCACGPA